MKSIYEIERKFLVKLPLSQEASEYIAENGDAPTHIVQTYLISASPNGDVVERVRLVTVDMWGASFAHFTHTTKKFVSAGINEEVEVLLNKDKYDASISRADLTKESIDKVRYFIPWADKLFELDIFGGSHEGLAILEIELTSMDEPFELPPFLEVIREVTAEKEYSNNQLADKLSEIE